MARSFDTSKFQIVRQDSFTMGSDSDAFTNLQSQHQTTFTLGAAQSEEERKRREEEQRELEESKRRNQERIQREIEQKRQEEERRRRESEQNEQRQLENIEYDSSKDAYLLHGIELDPAAMESKALANNDFNLSANQRKSLYEKSSKLSLDIRKQVEDLKNLKTNEERNNAIKKINKARLTFKKTYNAATCSNAKMVDFMEVCAYKDYYENEIKRVKESDLQENEKNKEIEKFDAKLKDYTKKFEEHQMNPKNIDKEKERQEKKPELQQEKKPERQQQIKPDQQEKKPEKNKKIDYAKEMKNLYNSIMNGMKGLEKDGWDQKAHENDERLIDRNIKSFYISRAKNLKSYSSRSKNKKSLQDMSDQTITEMLLNAKNISDEEYEQQLRSIHQSSQTDWKVSNEMFRKLDVMVSAIDYKRDLEKIKLVKQEIAKKSYLYGISLKPPESWHQHEYQHYGNSCWAAAGANLVNMFNSTNKTGGTTEYSQENFLETGVIKNKKPHEYDEVRMKKSYTLNTNGDETGIDNINSNFFLNEKDFIEDYKRFPGTKQGNINSVFDEILEATNNKGVIYKTRYNVPAQAGKGEGNDLRKLRRELKQLKLIEDVHNSINVNKSPVSVLNGGHYLTIIGIKKNGIFICKDPGNRSERTKDNNRDLSVEDLFYSCETNSRAQGTVETYSMQLLTKESWKQINGKFTRLQSDFTQKQKNELPLNRMNEADNSAASAMSKYTTISVEEYPHVKGVDSYIENKIERDREGRVIDDEDKLFGSSGITETIYVPLNLPKGIEAN